MGRVRPSALRVHTQFFHFIAEEGCSSLFDQFINCGFDVLPAWHRSRYPFLQNWRGWETVKQQLGAMIPCDCDVFLANRSLKLIELGARMLCRLSSRVLTVDSLWPGYKRILAREAGNAGVDVVEARVIRPAFNGEHCVELIDRLAKLYAEKRCTGLFLPAICHFGIRLGIAELVNAVESDGDISFLLVDGAQEFGHAPLSTCLPCPHFYVTGAHKWLRSGHVMGIAWSSIKSSRTSAKNVFSEIDDPLLHATSNAELKTQFDETVNLISLLTTSAALGDATAAPSFDFGFDLRLGNRAELSDLVRQSDWQPIGIHDALHSGILLLRNKRLSEIAPVVVRQEFLNRGLAISTFADGVIRLSLPDSHWRETEIEHVMTALCDVSRRFAKL